MSKYREIESETPVTPAILRLEARKDSLFLIIQQIYDLSLEVSDPEKEKQFIIRAQSLDKTREDFMKTLDTLIEAYLENKPNSRPNYAPLNAFDTLYCQIQHTLSTIKEKSPSQKFQEQYSLLNKKLPPIQLQKFSGIPSEFPVFFENFQSLIHNNQTLSDVQKVQYLTGCLTGKALLVCAGIPPTGENYEIIWNSLLERYQDTRVQAAQLVDSLINCKPNQQLEAFVDQFCSAEAALRRLKIDDLSDFMITHIALSKLNKETVSLFEQNHKHIKIPTFADLNKFLKEQIKILTLRSPSSSSYQPSTAASTKNNTKSNQYKSKNQSQVYTSTVNNNNLVSQNSQRNCVVCKTQISHPLYKCEYFLNLDPKTKLDIINQYGFCRNCLGFHRTTFCKSSKKCFRCFRLHHSSICDSFPQSRFEPGTSRSQSTSQPLNHRDTNSQNSTQPLVAQSQPLLTNAMPPNRPTHSNSGAQTTQTLNKPNDLALSVTTMSARSDVNDTTVLLPTASVCVYDKNIQHYIRIFLDSGSMSNFVSKECCQRLNLKIQFAPSTIKGIGQTESNSLGFVTFKIHSRFDPRCSYTVHARVIDTITDFLPNSRIDISQLSHLSSLPMADANYHTPGPIDCLIGNELFPILLGSHKVTSSHSSVVAIQSSLGYLLMGKANCDNSFTHSTHTDKTFLCSVDSPSLEEITQRFWSLENVPDKPHLSPDDEACERIFQDTYSRDATGRYTVHLPFKEDPSQLGDSFTVAKRRLLQLEKKLDSNPTLRNDYNSTIQSYIDKGYLTKVENPSREINCYHIPHRAIYRPEKTTSKTRIVLNASNKSSSGKSLNDLLYIGPNLQNNIFELLINLRLFSTVLTADVEKHYFQINLTPEHHAFQRILFRFDSEQPIDTYNFPVVSFGVSSSPYLAMRVVRQLAQDSADKYPLASIEAMNNMYMDDYINSIDGSEKAEIIYTQMVNMFKSGGFNLTKWISNDLTLLDKIKNSYSNDNSNSINFDTDAQDITKIVGMQWHPNSDNFTFKINSENDSQDITKRIILSTTARLFDPIGLIGPVTAFMKLLVQECWKLNLDWDSPVPSSISQQFEQFRKELAYLEQLKIPRHVGISSKSHITLIGYADASEKCYGATVFIRVSSDEHSEGTVTLLTSKSRVAPLKKTSLARLELCASLLLANLIYSVREILNKRCEIKNIFAFSDSTVTLTWIHSDSYKFHTFVANRITEINSKLPCKHWFHIDGRENPADIISRPITPKELLNRHQWFHAQEWTSQPISQWPVKPFQINTHNKQLEESKTTSLMVETSETESQHPIQILAERVSSWSKLLRVVVFILRFSKHLHSRGSITVSDLNYAELYVIRYIQQKHFSQDIQSLKNNKPCSKVILKLNPFLEDDIIRVGGRLSNSQLNFGQKHPIILPSKERITQLIVDYYHITNLHTGPALLLALLRQKFWIISARNLIRQRVHKCNICFRLNPKPTFPQMGDLPNFRVSQVKAFVHTAVDYMGPFYVTHVRRRGIKSQKAYVCVFTCLATKAVHLELVSDLSSDLFLGAILRLVARRGAVSLIYSDQASNFIGAKRRLNELYTFIQSNAHKNFIEDKLIEQRIKFLHSPPYGPHFNGLSEIHVRCVKTHLYRVIGTQILTYEELTTVLIQIENLLNSRPLCVLSSDPSDLSALTPNHFLNVTPLKYLPIEDLIDVPVNRLSRYQLLTKITQSFWQRWSQEYLTSLHQRQKWNTPSNPIKLGTVVVIKDLNTHPLCWPLGIIEKLYPGKDNIVRTVKVTTRSGSYIRPVVRVCPLPTQ